MIYVVLGVIAFLLFILYDINSVKTNYKLVNCAFAAGFILLIAATGGLIAEAVKMVKLNDSYVIIMCSVAALFLVLQIYTLFFALPFKKTYIENNSADSKPVVCKTGVYALCRHPGILSFVGFFLFLSLAFPVKELIIGGILFSLLNIAYVILQDLWTFPKTFSDYAQYKREVPFLIPTFKSVSKCVNTLKGKKHYEV